MAKSNPTKEIEILPDDRQRFERAAGVVAKSPPQHPVAKKKRITKKAEARSKKSK
jgi:hypothetical protein